MYHFKKYFFIPNMIKGDKINMNASKYEKSLTQEIEPE